MVRHPTHTTCCGPPGLPSVSLSRWPVWQFPFPEHSTDGKTPVFRKLSKSFLDRTHRAPRHIGNRPDNDEFINIDIRVMGQSVLVGYLQIL